MPGARRDVIRDFEIGTGIASAVPPNHLDAFKMRSRCVQDARNPVVSATCPSLTSRSRNRAGSALRRRCCRRANSRIGCSPAQEEGRAVSRAFVREEDGSRPEVLPEIPVSTLPNLVTARGFRLITARVAELESALAASPDDVHAARLERDLRYWSLRHATARLTAPDPADPTVQFGSRVTYRQSGENPDGGRDRRGRGRSGHRPHRLRRADRPGADRQRGGSRGHARASRPRRRSRDPRGRDPKTTTDGAPSSQPGLPSPVSSQRTSAGESAMSSACTLSSSSTSRRGPISGTTGKGWFRQ